MPYHSSQATNKQLRAGGVLCHLHSRLPFCPCLSAPLIHGDAQLPQLPLGDLDLAHELVVGLGDVVEGQDAPAEADEQVGAEGDEGPEGQDGHDLGLDDGGEGDQVEVEGEVGLFLFTVLASSCEQHYVLDHAWVGCCGGWHGRTELTRRAMEMVCWARVILLVGVWWFLEGIIGRLDGWFRSNGCLWKGKKWALERSDANGGAVVNG